MTITRPKNRSESTHRHDRLERHDLRVIRRDDRRQLLWMTGPALILLLVLAGFIGWAIGDEDPAPREIVVTDADGTPTTADTVPPSDAQAITLTGEVDEVIGTRLFMLGAEGDDARILVFADAFPDGMAAGSVVRISGEARAIDTLLDLDSVAGDETVMVVARDVVLLSPR